jgi:phage baseplate assembly protein W
VTRLPDPPYLQFPLVVDPDGPRLADRARHVRDVIEQVLLTNPGERVFRPDFGAGVQALVFEPDARAVRELARTRILSSLAEALAGEVDARSLTVEIDRPADAPECLDVVVRFALGAVGQVGQHALRVGAGRAGHG